MALARLVTRTPELAQTLARSLEAAGYSVEFASPDVVSHGVLLGLPLAPADLEVNLDDPSAASSYLMTADGKEISFAYDPYEREFVLAPAWRQLKELFAPLLQNLQHAAAQRREARVETARLAAEREAARMQAEHEAEHLEAARLEAAQLQSETKLTETKATRKIAPSASDRPLGYDPDSVLTTEMPVPSEPGSAPGSLYLPEPTYFAVESEPEIESVEFSGADYFDGQGTRKLAGHERAGQNEMLAASEPAVSVPTPSVPTPSVPTQAAAPEAPTPRTPWLVSAALRAEVLRTSLAAAFREQWQQQRNALTGTPSRLRAYDAAWLRSVPVAAIITLAFLLGWAIPSSQRPSPTSPVSVKPLAVNNADKAQQEAIVPLPQATSAHTKPLAAKPAPTKRVASRYADPDAYEDEEDADIASDVVIRHYPSKNIRAAAQKGTVKRFSDLD